MLLDPEVSIMSLVFSLTSISFFVYMFNGIMKK